ncbi:MAG: hypothetical protein IPP69_04540 [Flavobacteriales bacterium]|nr:hypothetical protein [Flavobacteriales bacterium]
MNVSKPIQAQVICNSESISSANAITSNEGLIALNPPEEDLQGTSNQSREMIKERGMLERKVDQIGTNWKNEIAFEINHCDAQIALRNDLITQLNTYKATLAA